MHVRRPDSSTTESCRDTAKLDTDARTALRQQLLERRYHQTNPILRNDTTLDNKAVFMGIYPSSEPDEEDADTTDKQPAETRRSGCIKKTRGSKAECRQENKQ